MWRIMVSKMPRDIFQFKMHEWAISARKCLPERTMLFREWRDARVSRCLRLIKS